MAGTNKKHNSKFFNPIIILKSPQLPENIGMVARTMLNFGFKNLRIVKPKIPWPNKKSISASAGAFDILRNYTQVYDNIEESLSDIEVLFATSVRQRDLEKKVISPKSAVRLIDKSYSDKKVAFLFGAEKSGLKNSDAYHANLLIKIPSNKHFGSLNLAMAVNIICYEWYIRQNNQLYKKSENKNKLSNKNDINYFIKCLLKDLNKVNFFKKEKDKTKLLNNFKNMITKNLITKKELKILYGIIKHLKKFKINN